MFDDENVEETTPDETGESSPPEETPEVTPSAEAGQEAEAAPAEEESAEKTDNKGAEPSGAEKRIKQLAAQRREAEREAEYWRGVAEGRVKPEDAPPASDGPPTPEMFPGDYESYLVAKAEYNIMQKLEAKNAQSHKDKVFRDYNKRVREAQSELDDFDAVARNPHVPVTAAMADAIIESEVGPKILYHLGQNLEEAERIASLSPIAAAREIGRLETRFLTPKPVTPGKKVTQAPEPINTLKGGGSPTVDDDKIPIDDWMRREREREAGRGK